MVLKTTKPRNKAIENFRDNCKLFVERKASIDYILDYIKKQRLIIEKKGDLIK